MSDTPVSDMAARKVGACAARWKDGSLGALEFANQADALLDPLRQLERENAVLRGLLRDIRKNNWDAFELASQIDEAISCPIV